MQLNLLRTTSCLSIYYDSSYNWLFLDWHGKLTLSAVQDGCVAVVECYLHRTYPRVLTSNLQVTGVGGGVASWLGAEFLPYMAVAGVEQVAWISAPSFLGRNLAQRMVNRVPGLALNWFDTTQEATAWLQQPPSTQLEGQLLPPRQTLTQVRLAQGVQIIRQEVQLIQQEVQHLQQKVGRRSAKSA
jgi:hypothetical protein